MTTEQVYQTRSSTARGQLVLHATCCVFHENGVPSSPSRFQRREAMDQHPCYICDKRVTVEGEGPLDVFCGTCRGKASDPEFVQRTLDGTPCVKPHCQSERRQIGILRRRNGANEYACSICGFVTQDSGAVLALLTEQVSARGFSGATARLERYHRWHAFNARILPDEDQRLLRPPGVPQSGPPTAPPIGQTRGNKGEYGLRRGDEGRLGPPPAPRKKK